MYFAFTDEQEEFRSSLRRLLADRSPARQAGQQPGSWHDPALWQVLVRDMGLPGLHIPEEFGGQGLSYLETAIVMSELGRALAPVPAAATIFAMEAIARCGSPEQRRALLPPLARGQQIASLAVRGAADLSAARAPASAARAAGGLTLRGTLPAVPHGHVADLIVVPAADPGGGGAGLYVVAADGPGVSVALGASLDLTRPAARVTLDGAPAQRLGTGPGGEQAGQVLDVARMLLAFESLGCAQRCLEMSVEYAKARVQFNRPIGSFQAVKHRCADMAIEIDASEGAAMYAAMVIDDDPVQFAQAAPLAKAQASETLSLCAQAMIQVHGGIGFTWEHDAHLFYRRAKANEVLLGSVAELRGLLADRIGI